MITADPGMGKYNESLRSSFSASDSAICIGGVACLVLRRRPHDCHSVVLSPQKRHERINTSLRVKTNVKFMRWNSSVSLSRCTEMDVINLSLKLPPQSFKVAKKKTQSDFNAYSNAKWGPFLTLMGEYHLDWDGEVQTGSGLGGGRGMMGSSASSGIVTTAFLAFSNRDPSSVDPFCPHRTYRKWEQLNDITDLSGSVEWLQTPDEHRFNASRVETPPHKVWLKLYAGFRKLGWLNAAKFSFTSIRLIPPAPLPP